MSSECVDEQQRAVWRMNRSPFSWPFLEKDCGEQLWTISPKCWKILAYHIDPTASPHYCSIYCRRTLFICMTSAALFIYCTLRVGGAGVSAVVRAVPIH